MASRPQNPADVYDGGMLLPAAGHKGYGLALLTDYLGGILTGAGGPGIPGSILGNGVLFVLLNIDFFPPVGRILRGWGTYRRPDQSYKTGTGLR